MTIPIISTYWVQPGHFLAGEYPGKNFPEQTHARLEFILSRGVNHIIDLTEAGELSPYTPSLLEVARQFKVEVIHQRLSIPDFSVPSPTHMLAIQHAIRSAITQGRIIYVHCHGGLGRTGMVVACHLVDRGFSGIQALEELQRLRQTLPAKERSKASPETQAQRSFVLAWKKPEKP